MPDYEIDNVILNGTEYDIAGSGGGGVDATGDGTVTIIEAGGSARGFNEAVKQALLQIALKAEYSDEHGVDYYYALEEAIYPSASVLSISAEYTQSGAVYNIDNLNKLKSDLVVTALYDDSTTETVSVYTLSGSLTVGTSTITVSFKEKTTTFNVTVTNVPYALQNGSHEYTANPKGRLVISNYNHISAQRTSDSGNNYFNFCNLSDLSYNSTTINNSSNVNNHTAIFALSSGDIVRFKASNVSGDFDSFALAFRKANGTSALVQANEQTTDCDVTITVPSDDGVGCFYLYFGTEEHREGRNIEMDVEVYVNGVRYF